MRESRWLAIWSSLLDVLLTKRSEKCTISGKSMSRILSSKTENIRLNGGNRRNIFRIFCLLYWIRKCKYSLMLKSIIDIAWIRIENSLFLRLQNNKKYHFSLSNFIHKNKKCWLYPTISLQTSSDSDFLNFWKNTVVDSNILFENLKIQIVSWQSFC